MITYTWSLRIIIIVIIDAKNKMLSSTFDIKLHIVMYHVKRNFESRHNNIESYAFIQRITDEYI